MRRKQDITCIKLYIHILQVCLRNNNKTYCTSTNKIHILKKQ